MKYIRPLEYDHSMIRSQLPCQQPVGRIHRIDLRRAVLDQAVGESAHVAPEIGAHQPMNVYPKMLQRELEFQPAFADERAILGPF